MTQRRFLPKVALILPRPSPAGSLAWHLTLPAKSHWTDLMLCYTWALLLTLHSERERAHLQEPLWMPAPDPGTKACLEGRQCWRTKGGLNPAPHPPHPPESFRVLQHSSNLLGCLRHNKVGDSSGLRGLEVRSSKPRSASGSCGHRSNVLSPLADAEFATVTLVPYSGPPRSDPIRCCRSVLQPG